MLKRQAVEVSRLKREIPKTMKLIPFQRAELVNMHNEVDGLSVTTIRYTAPNLLENNEVGVEGQALHGLDATLSEASRPPHSDSNTVDAGTSQ